MGLHPTPDIVIPDREVMNRITPQASIPAETPRTNGFFILYSPAPPTTTSTPPFIDPFVVASNLESTNTVPSPPEISPSAKNNPSCLLLRLVAPILLRP